METVFLSKTDVYNGSYSITRRDAIHRFSKEMHYHDFYEMQFYLCESEDGRIGEVTMNGKTRELVQGYMVLISMFGVHQVNITCKVPYTRYCISSDSSLLLFACSSASNLFNIFSHCADIEYPQLLIPAQIAIFVSTCSKHEHLTVKRGQDIMGKSLILEVFAHICDIFYDGQEVSTTDSRSLAVITELINYIDTNIAGDLSLERLAEHVNFSAFHPNRMFKQYTGTALDEYIITRRVDKAKLSLKSRAPVTTVGKEVGFNNYNHFYRAFKNVTSIDPTKYKEIMEKER